MEEMDEKEYKIRRMWIVIAIVLALVAIGLLVYVFCFKNKDKEKPKEEQSEPIVVKPTNPDDNKEEEKEENNETKELETTYEGITENVELIDTIGDYSIYRGESSGYLVDNKSKKVVDSSSEGYVFAVPIEFNQTSEEDCNLENVSKCDYYTFSSIGVDSDGETKEKVYFVNKKNNVISMSYYDYINCIPDQDGNHLNLCEYNDAIITGNTIKQNDDYSTKYGLLNINTGLEYIAAKYDNIREIGKDRFAVSIGNKSGLITKEDKQLLNVEYDFVGAFTTDNDITYLTIKGKEVKLFDSNMNNKQLKVTDKTKIDGIHDGLLLYSASVIKDNINSNEYFKYNGEDYKGEKYFLIFSLACGDFDEETNKYIDSKDSVIYVIENGEFKQLDPKQVEQNLELCGLDW